MVASVDRAGRTTAMVYDAAGRLVETQHPDGGVTRIGHDKAGREVRREDARGNATLFGYDDAGRRSTVTDALGRSTTTTFNSNGTPASIRDALGRVTKFVHDAMGRLVETIHPDATTTDTDNPRSRIGYDARARKANETDEMGRVTAFEYNATGQLSAVIDAAGGRTTYAYDEVGNRVAQVDALGRATRWTYDDAGRVITHVLPGGQTESWQYDAVGNRVAWQDFNGATTQYRYDTENREVEVRYAEGGGVVTKYTAAGRVATQVGGSGVTAYTYDAMDRMLSVVHPDGVAIVYAYDVAGNRSSMTTAHQDVVYGYDQLNRLASITRDGGSTTYGYDEVGNRSLLRLPNGNRTDYTYDLRNRLKTLFHRTATSAVLLGLTYTVDASGLRMQAVESGAGATRTVAYQYDALKRLKREQVTDSTRGNRTTDWTYDAAGNRLTQSRTKAGITRTTTYTYDSNDRLEREDASDGTAVQYRYDANGALIERSDRNGRGVYSYDGAGRLVDATTPAGAMSYRYDADGIRQEQTVNGVTTRFVVDPVAEYDQVIEEHGPARAVFYLVGDDRIARSDGSQTTYLHADGLGSTRLLTTAAGAPADRYWYEAFGEAESHTGTSDNAFLFAGEQLDPNLGFYYLRARYLDPSTGRFAAMDPWSGRETDPLSLHKYLYAHADAVNNTDPSGYMTLGSLSISINMSSTFRTTSYAAGKRVVKKFLIGKPPEDLGLVGELIVEWMFQSVIDVGTGAMTKQEFGQRAHKNLKTRIESYRPLPGFVVIAEPFFIEGEVGKPRKGNPTGSVGVDVFIEYQGRPLLGLELKTGAGYRKPGKALRMKRMGTDLIQVQVIPARG